MGHTAGPRPDLGPASEHATLGVPLPRGTRMRFVKRLVLRATRVFTHHQVAFNEAILTALEESITRAEQLAAEASMRLELGLRQAYADRHEGVASLRFDLVAVQQQLVSLQQDFSPTTQPQSLALTPFESESLSPTPRPHVAPRWPESPGKAPGVNVFGDWAATTGLAQAARRLTVALHDAGLDLSVGTVHSGAPLDDRRVPDVLRRLPDDRPHAIELWMLNVNEFPVIGEELLRPPGRDTYAIGVWYWELPTFPERFVAQIDRVDEIWVATRFVQASFRRVTTRPVHVVPAIVPELKGSGRIRKDFGLDEDEVVFLFSFDVNSAVARKNPGAVVEAFARAFPSPSECRSRLVIKVLNLDLHPDVARWLRPAVESVNGMLIEDDLAHAELIDLFSCSDAYVSLHRSEGFGFGIAEAMALGKPVIATAYSGNLDFATAANSCQVSYRLREITRADHVYNAGISAVYERGAIWADPDLDQAARWMQLVAADPALRARIGEAARTTIREHYSAQSAVAAVVQRLREVEALRAGSDRPIG